MLSAKERGLLEAIEPRAEREGVEIVTIEVVGAKKAPTIRVYIDTPQGVSFDELASSQVWISEIVERIDPFPGAYTLEVSSPGIDRPLRTREHFERFAGGKAVLKTVKGEGVRSNWTGILAGVRDDVVLLDVEGSVYELPLENIKKAQLKGVVDFSS